LGKLVARHYPKGTKIAIFAKQFLDTAHVPGRERCVDPIDGGDHAGSTAQRTLIAVNNLADRTLMIMMLRT